MNYIDKEKFVFELIVCKARGKLSVELSNMFWLISIKIKDKPPFSNIPSFNDDQTQEAYCMMLETWRNVEVEKYNASSIFAYFTERAKRSYVKIFDLYMDRNYKRLNGEFPKKVRLGDAFHL